MRIVVGYVPDRRGREAVRLGVTLAGAREMTLDVVVVLPDDEPTFDMYSPDRAYQQAMHQQGLDWLERAMTHVPDGVTARGHVRHAPSITEGLIAAATDPELGPEAEGIVIGAANRGLMGFITLGTVASALLHSAPVPVVLAPAGYEAQPAISRITCALGRRQGAEAVLDVAIDAAARRGVPLRLMSLVALDEHGSAEGHTSRIEDAEAHEATLVERAVAALPGDLPVTGVVGTGKTLEDCVGSLEFTPSEIVLLGSSRLGSTKRVFLSASANKILRALQVPVVVVPRDYEPASS